MGDVGDCGSNHILCTSEVSNLLWTFIPVFLWYQVWNHLEIFSETGRGKLLLWQWEHLLRPFRARLLPHWKCKDCWISMSWKKGSCKFFHAKIKGGVLRGSVMLQRGFLMPASPWWLWIGKTEQNRKCGEHCSLGCFTKHFFEEKKWLNLLCKYLRLALKEP